MWEVTAAVIATALGIVVLPFVMALISGWLDARRQERKRRRDTWCDTGRERRAASMGLRANASSEASSTQDRQRSNAHTTTATRPMTTM